MYQSQSDSRFPLPFCFSLYQAIFRAFTYILDSDPSFKFLPPTHLGSLPYLVPGLYRISKRGLAYGNELMGVHRLLNLNWPSTRPVFFFFPPNKPLRNRLLKSANRV